MSEWEIKLHPYFFKDLDRLDKKHLEIFYKKKKKIKENPLRQKHLGGGENCYREPITKNIRLVYYIEDKIIWFLINLSIALERRHFCIVLRACQS